MNECLEPVEKFSNEVIKTSLNILSGVIPVAGGLLSAISASWSEHNQEKMNEFLKYRQYMLENDLKEQWETLKQVIFDLDKLKVDVSRISCIEFQSLVQRCFRDWSRINSKSKREYIKNILVNSASTTISSHDLIRLFIDWINQYSDFHFQVIACIYNNNKNGISRGQIWLEIGKKSVREDSAESDLYKLLIRDLSTGGIIRQYRPTDYNGNFIAIPTQKSKSRTSYSSGTLESAFDMSKKYVLTDLGQQFVHYTMSDVSIKIEHQE